MPRCLGAVLIVASALVGCSAAPSTAPLAPAAVTTTTSPVVAVPTTSPPSTVSPPSIVGPGPPSTVAPTTVPATGAVLPDPVFTPGAINPAVTPATIGQTICASGWTATVRPPVSYTDHIKVLEDGAGGTVTYQGVTYPVHGFRLSDRDLSHFELDHLIALELGGNPADPRNLWMEPYQAPKGTAPAGTGSQTKDQVENAARSAVCAGRLALDEVQRQMAVNWAALGRQLGVIP